MDEDLLDELDAVDKREVIDQVVTILDEAVKPGYGPAGQRTRRFARH